MEFTLMTVVWAVVFVAAIIIESQTAEMVAIWFVPGALVSLVMSSLRVSVWIQCVTFLVLSVVLMILGIKIFRKMILKNHGKTKTDTDRIIGELARVEERISNLDMCGAVKIGGQVWTARMADDGDIVEVGEFVRVESISGVKLICVKNCTDKKE